MNKKHAVISLSGGLDSSTLLLRLLRDGYEVTALSFDYGQKHRVELERAQSLIDYLNGNVERTEQDQLGTITVTGKNFNPIKYRQIHLNGLANLLDSSLVTGGSEVPEGYYEQDNMKDTVVPNRNKIFSSIIQAVALSISNKNNSECVIALGIHCGDHSIYPDCRSEFRDADYNAFLLGNWDADKVTYYTPYLEVGKFEILQDGEISCKELGLDFNEVYKRTMTSYKPIYYCQGDEYGEWYSDYKSASSVERSLAFIQLGRPDPTNFADETGPVSWEKAKEYALKVERDFKKQ